MKSKSFLVAVLTYLTILFSFISCQKSTDSTTSTTAEKASAQNTTEKTCSYQISYKGYWDNGQGIMYYFIIGQGRGFSYYLVVGELDWNSYQVGDFYEIIVH